MREKCENRESLLLLFLEIMRVMKDWLKLICALRVLPVMSLEPLYFLAAELRLADLSLCFDRGPSSYDGLGESSMAEGGGEFRACTWQQKGPPGGGPSITLAGWSCRCLSLGPLEHPLGELAGLADSWLLSFLVLVQCPAIRRLLYPPGHSWLPLHLGSANEPAAH